MTVRGAHSIDRHYRIEGKDWWADEELSYGEMSEADETNEPGIMITHDAPHDVRKALFDIDNKTITSNGFQAMWELHQPDMWTFEHHHKSRNKLLNGTRFICLAELETMLL